MGSLRQVAHTGLPLPVATGSYLAPCPKKFSRARVCVCVVSIVVFLCSAHRAWQSNRIHAEFTLAETAQYVWAKSGATTNNNVIKNARKCTRARDLLYFGRARLR